MIPVFITGNPRKFAEAKAIIPQLEQLDIDVAELQEIDSKKIIEHKLRTAAALHKGPLIVEDTGLHMECLGGLPGPLIKWFLKAMTDAQIAGLAAGNNRAKATCNIGYLDEEGTITFFEGTLHGTIVPPTGVSRFGWDAIFVPDGIGKSFQQMTTEEKNRISHRRIALQKLHDHLKARDVL